MPLIDILTERVQRHPKRVVFPEGSDPRIIQAARRFVLGNLGVPILLGDRTRIKTNAAELNIDLKGIRIMEPGRSDDLDTFLDIMREIPRFESEGTDALRQRVLDPRYFAALMLINGNASGLISGATTSAASAIRPMLQVLPPEPEVTTISSLQMLDFEEPVAGRDGVLFLADCAVIPNPTSEQLAEIAITTGALAGHLTGRPPRIAFLSYSSKASEPADPAVRKMQVATRLAQERAEKLGREMYIDGELQVDAALEAPTARAKKLTGPVAGKANVLIFPDLHAANIGSKLAQILTGARTYGPLLTGFQVPAAEISRSSSAHDIFGTAVMVAAQAIDSRFLHPTAEDRRLEQNIAENHNPDA